MAEETKKPEQLAHGVKNITTASIGTVLDTGPATITQILFTGAPTLYEQPTFDPTGIPNSGYFCITDEVAGLAPRVIYNVNGHINSGNSPHATHKISGYSIPYAGNLVCRSCPAGATYSLTTA